VVETELDAEREVSVLELYDDDGGGGGGGVEVVCGMGEGES
jgi:hypothetical protein